MKMITRKELSQEHQAEIEKLFQSLAVRYGIPATRVGTQLQNLMGVSKGLLMDLPKDIRDEREPLVRAIVEDAVKTMASMCNANMADVLRVADSLFDFAALVEGDDPDQVAKHGQGASEVIAKARA